MKRSKRLGPVLDHSAYEEKEIARELGECQQRLTAAETQLAELVAYRNDYVSRAAQPQGGGVNAWQMQHLRTFLDRLEQAVSQQAQQVERERQAFEQERQRWLEKHARHKALSNAVDRMKREEVHQADRQEQKSLDDLVNGRHARRGTGSN